MIRRSFFSIDLLGYGRHFLILFFEVSVGGGIRVYIGYIGMCGPKGYGFSAALVINRVSISAINRVSNGWPSDKYGRKNGRFCS